MNLLGIDDVIAKYRAFFEKAFIDFQVGIFDVFEVDYFFVKLGQGGDLYINDVSGAEGTAASNRHVSD